MSALEIQTPPVDKTSPPQAATPEVAAGRPTFNVQDFRTAGQTDDTVAIQHALDAAARAGGGAVYFPAGTYWVTSVPGQDWILQVASNTEVYGEPAASVIKVRSGSYNSIFLGNALSNVYFHDLVFDQNPVGNIQHPVDLTRGNGQSVLTFPNFSNLRISNVEFSPCCGVWAIWATGKNGNTLNVDNCRFSFMNGRQIETDPNQRAYDTSEIYAQGNDLRITDNLFLSRISDFGRTAIEVQGNRILIERNLVDGFIAGVIVTNSLEKIAEETGPVLIHDNRFLNVEDGIELWASERRTLRNVQVTQNTLSIAAHPEGSWEKTYHGFTAGILGGGPSKGDPDSYTGDLEGLLFADNQVTFLDLPPDFIENGGQVTAGVSFDGHGNISNFSIVRNKIVNAPFVAIHLGNVHEPCTLTNGLVQGNTLVHSHWSPNAPPTYRDAIKVDGPVVNVTIFDNLTLP